MEQKRLKEFADYERNYILTINYKSNTVYSVNLWLAVSDISAKYVAHLGVDVSSVCCRHAA